MDNGVSALSLCMSTCCTVGGFRVPGFVFMMVIANLGVTPSSAALTGLPIVSAPSAASLWGGGGAFILSSSSLSGTLVSIHFLWYGLLLFRSPHRGLSFLAPRQDLIFLFVCDGGVDQPIVARA